MVRGSEDPRAINDDLDYILEPIVKVTWLRDGLRRLEADDHRNGRLQAESGGLLGPVLAMPLLPQFPMYLLAVVTNGKKLLHNQEARGIDPSTG